MEDRSILHLSKAESVSTLRGILVSMNWGHMIANPDRNIDDTMWGGETICPECGVGSHYGHKSSCTILMQIRHLDKFIEEIESMTEADWQAVQQVYWERINGKHSSCLAAAER